MSLRQALLERAEMVEHEDPVENGVELKELLHNGKPGLEYSAAGQGTCSLPNSDADMQNVENGLLQGEEATSVRGRQRFTLRGSTLDRVPSCMKKPVCLYIIILVLVLALTVSVSFNIIQHERQARATLPAPHCDPPCPCRWIGYEGKCYFFSREKRNWTSSQNFCSSFNASLTRIEIDEKDFVMRPKCKDISWIGLRRGSDNSWLWADGEMSILEVFGEGGNCAYLDNEGKAISSGCHTKLPCICSKPAAYTTPNTVCAT